MSTPKAAGSKTRLGGLKVLLVGQGQPEMGSLRGQLEALGYDLVLCERGAAAPAVVASVPLDLVIVDVTSPQVEGARTCKAVKEMGPQTGPPVLLATLRADHAGRSEGAAAGADGFITKPVDSDELHSQLQVIHHNRQLAESLRRENQRANQLNAELLSARAAQDAELELARRLQGSLLPRELPSLPNVRLAATLRPSGAVSGDFYDVIRLDEHHIGFYVADAIGHGVPAALLTIFVKKGIYTKDVSGQSYRLLPPAEVLARLNEDIISAALSDTPFVTMFYASLDLRTLELEYSTGGHPMPLVLHADGTSEELSIEGPLLGIFREPFPNGTFSLRPGDRVIAYSDGVEDARGPEDEQGIQWMQALYRANSALPLAQQVSHVLAGLFAESGPPRDDTTMLVLEVLK